MHPDIQKALRILTKHASMAQAEKSFGHLIKNDDEGEYGQANVCADLESPIPGTTEQKHVPAPGKGLDDEAHDVMIQHDANHPAMSIEDDFGALPAGEPQDNEGDEPDGIEREEPLHVGIVSTIERTRPTAPPSMPARESGIHESAKRRRGRPPKSSY